MQSADRALYRHGGLETSGLDHVAIRIKNAQLAADLLRKETDKVNGGPRLSVAKNHRFRQRPAAQLETIRYGAQIKRVHSMTIIRPREARRDRFTIRPGVFRLALLSLQWNKRRARFWLLAGLNAHPLEEP